MTRAIRHGGWWWGLVLASASLPAWAGHDTAHAKAAAEAQQLADSQQQVVELSNQLQGLQAKADASQQVLNRQDQQIARLKAALGTVAPPAAARSH